MRKDGKRIRCRKPFFEIIPYMVRRRTDAQVSITQEIDAAAMREYIAEKRGEGAEISYLSLFITAFFKTALEYEQLNDFVVNKKIYRRSHFCVSLITQRSDSGGKCVEQTVSKLLLEPEDDLFSISRKISDAVGEDRERAPSGDMDKMLGRWMHFPGPTGLTVGMVRLLDRYGLLPRKVLDASPFHTSLFVTDRTPGHLSRSARANRSFAPVATPLYEFGTAGISAAIGPSEKRIVLQRSGHLKEKIMLPVGMVVDTRIASGHYYAEVIQKIENYLENPELLEKECTRETVRICAERSLEEAARPAVAVNEPAGPAAAANKLVGPAVAANGAECPESVAREPIPPEAAVSPSGEALEKRSGELSRHRNVPPSGDLKAACKIAWTQFRGSRWLFPGLREVWYDRELSQAISRLEKPFIPFFVLLAGLCGIGLALAGKASQEQILLAMGGFVLLDILLITPLLFYAVLPKPIAPHIKRVDSLSEEERALYKEEKRTNERVERIFHRYRVPGRPGYKDYRKKDEE